MQFQAARKSCCLVSFGLLAAVSAQTVPAPSPALAAPVTANGATSAGGAQPPMIQPGQSEHEEAKEQLKAEEKQRAMKVIPDFNTVNFPGAVPLSPGQKFQLAFRGAIDPFQFVTAGFDAAFSQTRNGFAGYGQGGAGYAKRFGASYADSFNSAMIGNALLPSLLHQDPRYFRRGTGTFASRFFYAVSTSVRCRDDEGKWVPNYSDMLGDLAAGGLSNLYYPPSDRGVGLTFQRALTQSAEGAIGAVFFEFWPDISRKLPHSPFRRGSTAAAQ